MRKINACSMVSNKMARLVCFRNLWVFNIFWIQGMDRVCFDIFWMFEFKYLWILVYLLLFLIENIWTVCSDIFWIWGHRDRLFQYFLNGGHQDSLSLRKCEFWCFLFVCNCLNWGHRYSLSLKNCRSWQ